jgi:adenine phosphoribosyltransferase
MAKTVKDYIRTIVDFPHEGILFRDVTTLFADPRGFRMCVDQLLAPYAGLRIDKVVGLEARGFILGGAVAHQLSTGFVPIRKKGKLPGQTIWNTQAYKLEYGEAVVDRLRLRGRPARARRRHAPGRKGAAGRRPPGHRFGREAIAA